MDDTSIRISPVWLLDLLLPRELAADAHDVECVLYATGHQSMGVHVKVIAREGTIATFPWWDHADRDLARIADRWIPDDGEVCDDLEQGWYLAVRRDGDLVYVFDSDFDRLCNLMRPNDERSRRTQPRTYETVEFIAEAGEAPGAITVGGVPATWFRLPVAEFHDAWTAALRAVRGDLPS